MQVQVQELAVKFHPKFSSQRAVKEFVKCLSQLEQDDIMSISAMDGGECCRLLFSSVDIDIKK